MHLQMPEPGFSGQGGQGPILGLRYACDEFRRGGDPDVGVATLGRSGQGQGFRIEAEGRARIQRISAGIRCWKVVLM